MLFVMATLAQAMTIRTGHGGVWYDPARSGEGWVLEILNNNGALLYWFTYDEDGNQRWLTAVGQTTTDGNGQYLRFDDLVLTTGGRFGPGFDPDAVVRTSVGSADLRFQDCDHGEFSFTAFGQSLTIQVERLTRTMATFCDSPNGQPGHPISAEAGQSGSWFDPAHNGEGYALQWLAPGHALVTWYSFDPDGNPYWMLGTGSLDNQGQLHLPLMHATRGARFGAAFDPDDVERFAWGELTLDLGCDSGEAQYASVLSPFGNGDFDLVRLTRPRGLGCPWQAPELFDLYTFSVEVIPHLAEDGETEVRMHAVTDGGAVLGVDAQGRIYRWLTDEPDVELWLDDAPESDHEFPALRVSDDGGVLYRRGTVLPMIHQSETGWIEIEGAGALYESASINAMSSNGTWLIGRGTPASGPPARPWVWNAEFGLFEPPASDEIGFWVPQAIANDGTALLGHVIGIGTGLPRPVPRYSVISIDGAEPVLLRDSEGAALGPPAGCSSDCRIVFGSGIGDQAPAHRQGEAWYWLSDGRHAYIGAAPSQYSHALRGRAQPMLVSGDGTLVVGLYQLTAPSPPTPPRVFLWTQRTGLVDLYVHGDELYPLLGDWVNQTPVALSSNGQYLLMSAEHRPPGSTSPFPTRNLLLHLASREHNPLPIHPSVTCDPRAVVWTLGQLATPSVLEQARSDARANTARFVRQGGDSLTADINHGRLNLTRNQADVVVHASCG